MTKTRRLFSYSAPYWPWLTLALALILFISLVVNFLPVLLQRITDECLINTTTPAAERIELLIHLGVIYLVMPVRSS